MAEHIERECKDCFYSGVCPGLAPFRERDDTDAERCEAYTDSKDGKLLCGCCSDCRIDFRCGFRCHLDDCDKQLARLGKVCLVEMKGRC